MQRQAAADQLRRIDLKTVLRLAGAIPDRSDRNKWHTNRGVISVSGLKFINWNECSGGGGAIDLVIHLKKYDFKTAVLWLSGLFPSARIENFIGIERTRNPTLLTPQRDDSQLHRVTRYLVTVRHIEPWLVKLLIDSGTLYADARANAVFLLLGKEKRVVGAELRGTTSLPWRGMAPGSRKDLGYFSIQGCKTTNVVLCESAIDAISCFALHPNCTTISTSGANPNPAWLKSLINEGCTVFCGFDSDYTGDKLAEKMIQLHPPVKRLRLAKHDWNDLLISKCTFCAKSCKLKGSI